MMQIPDLINGGFEAFAGFAILNHCFKVLQDKCVRGVSIASSFFFLVWGFWNVFYYPHLEQFWSCVGGVFVTIANICYFTLLIRYGDGTIRDWLRSRISFRVWSRRRETVGLRRLG